MPQIFDKVIQQASRSRPDLKNTLAQTIRERKITELDEATIDRNVQAEKTKVSELEAKEVEAQSRKVAAEANIMDKYMPAGMFQFFGELLKDRNPNSPMTVDDMIRLMEFTKASQETGQQQELPTDGMWGFLTAMITNMAANNQTTTPMELVDTILKVNALVHPEQQQQQGSFFSQFTEFAGAMQTFKDMFAPAQQNNNNDSSLIGLPGGGALPLDDLIKLQNHGYDLQIRREDHMEKIKNYESVRENTPKFVDALSEFAASMRGQGKNPAETGNQKKLAQVQEFTCPDCGMAFAIPAGIDAEIGCPRCTMDVIRRLEVSKIGDNIDDVQERSESKDTKKQRKSQGSSKVDPTGGS